MKQLLSILLKPGLCLSAFRGRTRRDGDRIQHHGRIHCHDNCRWSRRLRNRPQRRLYGLGTGIKTALGIP